MSNGSIKIHVKNAINLPNTDEKGSSVMARFTISKQPTAQTQLCKSKGSNGKVTFNETIFMACKKVKATDRILVELLDSKNNVLATAADDFETISIGSVAKIFDMRSAQNEVCGKFHVIFNWFPNNDKDTIVSKAEEEQGAFANPQRSLTTADPVGRPNLLRLSFYYQTGKNIYDYTTAFRFIAPVAKFGESSCNYVLSKLGVERVNSTEKLDQQIVPLLSTIDTKVDEQLTQLLNTVVKGQAKVLETKDAAVESVSNVASQTVKTVSHATDVALTTAKTASTSTFATVSSAAITLISYVPLVGKRVTSA